MIGEKCGDYYEIDPKAVLWRKQHPDDMECPRCPSCMGLPCMNKLYKICAHASLLQAPKDPDELMAAGGEKLRGAKRRVSNSIFAQVLRLRS